VAADQIAAVGCTVAAGCIAADCIAAEQIDLGPHLDC